MYSQSSAVVAVIDFSSMVELLVPVVWVMVTSSSFSVISFISVIDWQAS